MTGPDQPSAPAGWYPDPDGAPGTVRWWNGVSWSDVTTPAGPGVMVPAPVPQWQAGPAWPAASSQVAAPPAPAPAGTSLPGAAVPPAGSPGRGRVAWGIGLGALGLVLVVVVALLVGRGDGGGTGAGGTAATAPPAPSGNAFPPGTVRIIDQSAGIAYPYLGDGWFEFDLGPMAETTATAGQYFVTQDAVPSGGLFIAQCTSGPLSPVFGYAGPDSLAATLHDVVDSARVNYYPAPNEQEVLRDEALTVDGAPAHLVEFTLRWDVEGYDATGERAALLLIDVGREQPALLYLSIPNTHAELYGVINQVIAAVDVL